MSINYKKCFDYEGNLIQGLLIINPIVNFDDRGFFQESWNKKTFGSILIENRQKEELFVQDNHSKSVKGTLRGLHYQKDPYAQGKLVRCTSGSIYDVAVDLRANSNTYKEWVGIELNENKKSLLWIPKGFAHGFLVLSETARVNYQVDNYYNPNHEYGINAFDKSLNLNIISNNTDIISSHRDKNLPYLKDCQTFKF